MKNKGMRKQKLAVICTVMAIGAAMSMSMTGAAEWEDDADLLCRIPYGTEFYVDGYDGDWGYTTVDGVTGWIDTNYADLLAEEPYTDDINYGDDDFWMYLGEDGADMETDEWFGTWISDEGFYKDGSGIYSDEYIFPESQYMYLTKADVSHLTVKGLSYARNSGYHAVHGHGRGLWRACNRADSSSVGNLSDGREQLSEH